MHEENHSPNELNRLLVYHQSYLPVVSTQIGIGDDITRQACEASRDEPKMSPR